MISRSLAAWLGCSLVQLHGLALCHRPEVGSAAFDADVRATAAGIGCDAQRLARLLDELAPARAHSGEVGS